MTRADRLSGSPRKNRSNATRDRVELEHVPEDGYWIVTAMDIEIGFLGRAHEASKQPAGHKSVGRFRASADAA